MKHSYTYILTALVVLFFSACNPSPNNVAKKKSKKRQPVNYANYVVELITYKIKKSADTVQYQKLDAVVQQRYTQKQPGYISKESGMDQKGNLLVMLSWDNVAHANADHQTFMKNPLWASAQKIIDTATISRKLFMVKDDHSSSLRDLKPYVIELATFKEKSQVKRDTFEKRDLQIETDYISRQGGYITRRIGRAENGERLMIIFWKTLANADAGMKQFRKDKTVADYAKMIDWKTVNLQRFSAL